MKKVKGRGFFIAFEGIDGSGKSTQSVLFYNKLKRLGYNVFHTRPGEGNKYRASPVSKAVKKITHDPKNERLIGVAAEAMLYMAQGAQSTEELIIPNLKAGKVVIADRFIYSVYALSHFGRGTDLNLLKRIGNFVTYGIIPDAIVLTDIPAKLAFVRKEKSKKKLGRKELMGPEFFEKVRQGFLKMSKEINPERWLVVDDAKLNVKEAEELIWDSLYPIIKKGGVKII